MIRCKFAVTGVKHMKYGPHTAPITEITLEPVYDTTIPEDRRFAFNTPAGQFKMTVNNPAALAELELGRMFYADFTPVEPAAQ